MEQKGLLKAGYELKQRGLCIARVDFLNTMNWSTGEGLSLFLYNIGSIDSLWMSNIDWKLKSRAKIRGKTKRKMWKELALNLILRWWRGCCQLLRQDGGRKGRKNDWRRRREIQVCKTWLGIMVIVCVGCQHPEEQWMDGRIVRRISECIFGRIDRSWRGIQVSGTGRWSSTSILSQTPIVFNSLTEWFRSLKASSWSSQEYH